MPSMNAESLVKNADTALYYSKEHGRDQASVFNSSMDERDDEEEEAEE